MSKAKDKYIINHMKEKKKPQDFGKENNLQHYLLRYI